MADKKILIAVLCIVSSIVCNNVVNGEFANQWAVYMHGGLKAATQVALEHGFRNMGPVGMLKDVYFFTHRAVPRRQRRNALVRNLFLQNDRRVDMVVQQVIKKRVKRDVQMHFNDKRWQHQWFLHNRDPKQSGHDMNVVPAWKKGITGKNVVITILDDGVEHTHRELKKNYDKNASYDYNDNDPDPMPRYISGHSFGLNAQNYHGTRCAAQVAAEANNSFCIVGVAYNAKIGGIRMLDGEVTDMVEASSLTHRRDYIDIYSSSWGPEDDGLTVDGPGNLTKQALKEGVLYGRNGKGNIFVWASGNGGESGDDCNCDGYTNSIYTVSAAAATSFGAKPWYLEECSSTLISTFGAGNDMAEGRIVTADIRGGCTARHTGTSVAAPFVAGFIALALEANPNLSWRDVQHILVDSARFKNLDEKQLKVNGANKKYSPVFGFGLVDGGALVDLALKWSPVSEQHICKTPLARPSVLIDSREKLIINIDTKGCRGTRNHVRFLEHTHVILSLAHARRGSVSIHLISPMGTRSRILGRRREDVKRGSFKSWAFLSTHFWRENPYGTWKLEIESARGNGLLEEWQLVMYGTEYLPGVPYPDANDQPFVPGQEGVRCHPECLEGCTGPGAHECVSCKNYRIAGRNKTCVPICPARYFTNDISLTCLPCHNDCWSCVGPASNQCISCNPGEYHYKNKCTLKCPPAHYSSPHDVGFKCFKCHANCLTCAGTADNCTTCRHEDILKYGHCFPRCGHGYFFDGINCILCHGSCHTCNGAGNRNCTSCRYRGLHSNFDFETMYFYKGSCLYTCPLNYYGDHIKGVCEPCGKNCFRCTSEGEQCTACKWGYFLPPVKRKDCVKECPKGQYPDLVNGLCRSCSKDCETCIPGRRYDCLTCKKTLYGPKLYLKKSTCDEKCDTGFFANKTSGMCQMCPYPCSACKGDKNCESCYINLNDERCIDKCPSGTFLDLEKRCKRCDPNCKECFGERAHQCLECQKGMVLRPNRVCSWTCPPGAFYKDAKEQICKPCHPACTQCSGPSSNECNRCVGNLQLRGTTCVQPCVDNLTENSCATCHPDCKSCFGATNTECLSCNHNKSLHEYFCTDRCPRGYYKQPGRLCMPCHRNCATCFGKLPSQCTSCPIGFSLYNGRCVLKCPKGYFKQEEWCLKCSDRCAECKHAEMFCMYCKKGKFLHRLECLDSCGEGYFAVEETRKCARCHRSCKTCFGFNANECLSCPPGTILYNSTCFDDCPARYIADAPTSLCNRCSENCISCRSEGDDSVCEHCRYPFVVHNGKCITSCPLIGYYSEFYSKRCKRCHQNCEMCYGPDKDECMLCKKGFSQVGSLCLAENCRQGYFVDSKTLKCRKCDQSCRSCSGPSSRQCTECHGDYVLLRNACVLGCRDGTYPDTKTGQCRLCHYSCKACNGPDKMNCTSCYEDRVVLNGKCHFLCKEGSYMDSVTGKCLPCSPRCKSCIEAGHNACTDCHIGDILMANRCLRLCPPGHFDNSTSGGCRPCEKSCKSCNGPTARNCTSCDRNYLLVEGTCVRGCSQGRYLDVVKGRCQFCHLLCNDCYGPAPTNCLSCKNGLILQDGKCKLQCADGSYPDAKTSQCKQCRATCKTCAKKFPNKCTSCPNGFKLRDGECVVNCIAGRYWDKKFKRCRLCESQCKTCSGSSITDCTSCNPGYSLYEGGCILYCNEGFYPDDSIGKCLPCKPMCKTCVGTGEDECLDCNLGYIKKNNQCVRDCKPDCFYNEVSGNCEKCVESCATCFGPKGNECTSCKINYNLVENTCLPACKGSEYLNEENWTCKACDSSCESCFGPSRENCTLCKPGFILIHNTCHMVCEEGKYSDYASRQCLGCSEGCVVCHGPGPMDCVVCRKGYEFLDVNGCSEIKCSKDHFFDEASWSCKMCHHDCETCDGEADDNCLSCREEYLLVNKSCLLKCPQGTFFNASNGGCHKCSHRCRTCNGPSNANCTSCFNGYTLLGEMCKETCVLGSYLSDKTKLCEICSDDCLTCDGPLNNNCTSCLPDHILANGSCITECSDESYFDNDKRKCLPCSSRCLSCNGATEDNCTACFGSSTLKNGKCVELCGEGLYMNSQLKQCIPCDDTCKTCIGSYSNDCTSCSFDKQLIAGSCISTCGVGRYLDRDSFQCKLCHPSCRQCSGPNENQCTQCSEQFLMIDGNCRLICREGTYPERAQYKCLDCDLTCKDCVGPTRHNCTHCFPNRELEGGTCKRRCPNGFFTNQKTDACERCNPICKECRGADASDCLACGDGYRLLNNTCRPTCPNGFLDGFGNCNSCDLACIGCSGPGPRNCTYCRQDGGLADKRLCKCPEGHYMSVNGNRCERCPANCDKCKGPGQNDCITCAEGSYFDHVLDKCSFICSSGTYVRDNKCLRCDASCQSCDGPAPTDCLLCSDTLVLFNASCIEHCPAGYYELKIHKNSICVICNEECKTCSGSEANDCTSCSEGLVIQQGNCVENCTAPYIADSAGVECVLPDRMKPPSRKLLSFKSEAETRLIPFKLILAASSLFIVVLFLLKNR